MDIEDKCEFLFEYARYENTECGEQWHGLATVLDSGAFRYGSDEFQKAVLKEVDETIEFIKTNFELIEEKRVVEKEVVDIYLEFIG